MIALIVVALGAVAAIVGTSVLAAQSTRTPRVYLIAWGIALFGLAVGLAAATLGLILGFGAVTFRAMELGVGLLAPLGFCLALVEVTGLRLASRFAMRLAASGIFVIAIAVMGTDPINPNAAFSKTWPDPTDFYQIAPLALLGFLAVFTTVTAIAVFAVVMRRSSRDRLPSADGKPVILLAVAAFVVVLPGLVRLLHSGAGVSLPLGDDVVFALCSLAAAVLAWYAAKIGGERNLARSAAAAARDDDDDPRYGRRSYRDYETGEFDEFASGRGGHGEYDDSYGSRRSGDDAARFQRADSDIRYPALAALAADPADPLEQPGLYREQDGRDEFRRYDERQPYEEPYTDGGPYPGDGFEPGFDQRGHYEEQPPYEQYDERGQHEEPGRYDEVGRYEEHGDGRQHGDSRPRSAAPSEMFGQITIYTLIEGRVEDFDRLTERVVALVQAKEPDTLVYIVHAVPTAPMQRILYEVYRDRAAHEEHLHRHYVLAYEADQRPFVLATNVIELGLQQAKVSPLPTPAAISDILSESGIDLTGITRSAQPGFSRDHREHYRHEDYRHEDYQRHPGQSGRHGGSPYDPPYQGWSDLRGEDSRY